MDEALSVEDRRYLRQMGANGMNLEARVDAEFPWDPDELAEFDRKERQALSEMNGSGLNADEQAGLVAEVARLRAELAKVTGGTPPPPSVAANYNGWKKADLEAEVDRVNAEDEDANLSKGTVEEMKAALTEYFTE